MKKYAFSFFALALALSLVSFQESQKQSGANQTYYWFHFQNGVLGSQVSSVKMTKEDAQQLTCFDVPGEDCARGYSAALNPESSSNPPLAFITTDQP